MRDALSKNDAVLVAALAELKSINAALGSGSKEQQQKRFRQWTRLYEKASNTRSDTQAGLVAKAGFVICEVEMANDAHIPYVGSDIAVSLANDVVRLLSEARTGE